MAVIPDVPGLEVCVEIDGLELIEHTDDDDDELEAPGMTTVFVQSQPGSAFRIRYRFDSSFPYQSDDIEYRIFLDGKHAKGSILDRKHRRKCPVGGHDCVRYTENGVSMNRPFTFAETNHREEACEDENFTNIKELGTISIRCIRCVKGHKVKPGHVEVPKLGYSVPEKKLKGLALSHQATLGEARKSYHKSRHYHPEYPHGKVPFATFNFKYRSKQALQSLRLIPDSPSSCPEPVPAIMEPERSAQDLTREELEEFYRASRRQTTHIKTEVKRERDEEVSGGASQRPRKTYRTSYDADIGAEVIDLSFDD